MMAILDMIGLSYEITPIPYLSFLCMTRTLSLSSIHMDRGSFLM